MIPHPVLRNALSVAALSVCAALSACAAPGPVPPSDARPAVLPSASGPPSARVDCRTVRCVALTFDAGPGPYTARLLDVLKEKDVRATFFLLGSRHVTDRPELVRREAAEGHELGNHTWSHPRLTELPDPEVERQLVRVQERVRELTGRTPTLMRPPQGRTGKRVAEVCRRLGLAQVLWSVTAKDYKERDPEVITRRVLAGARRDGIILLHDIYPGTVPAVPAIVDGLRARGLEPVTVSELFAPGVPEPGRVYRTAPPRVEPGSSASPVAEE
ncbi:polysaccharide deacetylase family protein [Streptomyces sp. NPDC001941]|uniref:polysaccharide deacetylase family protein n=1 Tax=Streptomyces sp. NPDC001941 TaxID=3154659 RepID=UPI0033312B3C